MSNITVEEIHAAADALAAQGRRPSQAAIRKALGDRGSYTTLSQAMQSWPGRQTGPASPVQEAPEAVLSAAKTLASQLWKAASEQAAQVIEAERAGLAAQRVAMEQERGDLNELADTLTTELEDAKSAIRARDEELAQLRLAVQRHQLMLESAERASAEAKEDANAARKEAKEALEAAAELRGRLRQTTSMPEYVKHVEVSA